MAQRAYGAAARPLRTARGTEYELFAEVTAALVVAGRRPAEDEGFEARGRHFAALVAAVHRNRQLWTALATDVASQGNALPKQLRAQLFYLAEFTEAQSRAVLRGGDVASLVEINRAVMQGLRPAAAASGAAA
jgi:flagellar protein FlaF